jgi:DNA-directed RNA polymerase subunit RPC12/RpoP
MERGTYMKCIICNRKGGNDNEGVITLQSTSHGTVCPRCINRLVGDVIKMRTPWTKEDLVAWGYDKGKLEAHMRGYIQRGEEE